MLIKKYAFLAGVLALLSTSAVQAQETGMYRGGSYNYLDSTLIPAKRMPQQRDFLNNVYDYPAKPRNQWEVGLNAGFLNVSGDVRSKSIFNKAINPLETMGWGLTVRKAFGYVMSARLQFLHGAASGYNYQKSTGYWAHATPWEAAGYNGNVHYNYKTSISELTLQAVASINNLKFHRAQSKASYYVLGGLGGLRYNTMLDLKDATGANYNFANVGAGLTGTPYENRKTINSQIQNLLDGEYETQAERHDNRITSSKATVRPVATMGAGVQFRLSKKLTLQVEDKVTMTFDDLIDGQRWQEQPYSTVGQVASSMTRDMDNINYLSVGLNMNIGDNAVAPLWWNNGMDYTYNAMKAKSQADDKCAKDDDGDGISNCFDRCPNTPANVSVDAHGCPFDTDGDGVPDYKDKQLITPTECQPVNADGVGKCPEPECCKNGPRVTGCNLMNNGSIEFATGSAKLSTKGTDQLNALAAAMRSNPNCKAVITGNGSGSKVEQQRSWDRSTSVINYMVDKQGIDRERFIFQYGQFGNANTVEYRSANPGEEGPSNIAPPFPNLRKNN